VDDAYLRTIGRILRPWCDPVFDRLIAPIPVA